MNNKEKYTTPIINELIVKLEQGIAAVSGNITVNPPQVNDLEEGQGAQAWDIDSF